MDLFLYDRGYPSYDFIDNHQRKGIDYFMRVKVSFSGVTKGFIASGRTFQIVEIDPGKDVDTSTKQYDKKTPIKVRPLFI